MAKLIFKAHTDMNGYTRWDIPASVWSGHEYGEDSLKIIHHRSSNEWYGMTEYDQCDKRDLDETDIASIRSEVVLLSV